MNTLKRLWRIFKWTMIVLILLVVLCGALLALPSVQTRLASVGTNYLHEEFGITIEVEAAAYQFPNVIHLSEVYVPDHVEDTLIYAQSIHFEFERFSNNHLWAGDVGLDGGKLYMRKYEGDTLFNFAMWLEHFYTDTPPDTTVPEFAMDIRTVEVSNFHYIKKALDCTEDCTFLDYRESALQASDFSLDGSYIEGVIDHLSFSDADHFNLYEFTARGAYQSNYMALEELYFRTDSSEVRGDARLEFRQLEDFEDFLNQVNLEGRFVESTVSSREFQSYIPEFPNFDVFTVDGSFNGPVHDLTVERMGVTLGSTKFFGDVHLLDCSEPENLYLDAFVGYCSTTGSDVQRYVNPFLDSDLPELLTELERLDLSGHFEGKLNSFKARSEISSNLGDAEVDLAFNDLDQPEKASYSGGLTLIDFDLGHLIDVEDVGLVTSKGFVEGQGMTAQSATAILDLEVDRVEFREYAYRNLDVEGEVSDRKFSGAFQLNDRLVSLDFDGILDFQKDTATLDFVATLDSADLYSTGFIGDTASWLGMTIQADFNMYGGEWWQGQVLLDSINYRRGDRLHVYDEFVLTSSNAGDITRNSIDSDFLDGFLEGHFSLFEIHKPLLKALATVSSYFPYEEEVNDFDVHFELELKRTDPLTELLIPDVRFAPGTYLVGDLNSLNDRISMQVNSPGMVLFGGIMDTAELHVNGTGGRYRVKLDTKSYMFSSSLESEAIRLRSTVFKDSATLDFKGLLLDSVNSDIALKGYMVQEDTQTVGFHWDHAQFNVGVDTLVLSPGNKMVLSPGRAELIDFTLVGANSEIALAGVLSSNNYEILRMRLNRMDMSVVNYLLGDPDTYFEGTATGMMVVNDPFNDLHVAGDVEIDSLRLNSELLGKLETGVAWDIASKVTRLNGSLMLGSRETMTLSGRIASDSTEPLLINLNLNRFRINAFNDYLQGILDNVRGMLEGQIRIAGQLSKPSLNGVLSLPNAAFSIPFLGTDYNFEGSPTIRLSSDRMILDRVKIRDTKEGTSGFASGQILHKNLSDLKFDLTIAADRLLGLDTEEGENNYFYGTAYASGDVHIVGPTDQMNLEINVEAEEGTFIRLPLSSPTEVGRNRFITFVDPNEGRDTSVFSFQERQKIQNTGGLNISVTANMRPEAQVQLILDEDVGGEINGNGAGLIRINLNPQGELSILGSYAVTSGDYIFNMRNIIAKRFEILQGSILQWTGDPYEAQIDLRAQYSTRTTLNGVVTGPSYAGQRVRVNLIMHLTGPLMNPNITFDVELPNANGAWQEELRNRLSDQDKMMDNAFSLLVTNSFWNPETSNIADDVVQQNLSQMASLMSNWAARSALGDLVDVSVDLNTYNNQQTSQYQSEVELGLSKTLFNERVTFNTNFDLPVNGGTTATGERLTNTVDVEVEYKITEDGRFRAKAFNRSNQNNPGLDQLNPYSQGVGIFYRADFETFDELIEKIFGMKPSDPEIESDSNASSGEEEVPDSTEPGATNP